jgi:hypothetical protein
MNCIIGTFVFEGCPSLRSVQQKFISILDSADLKRVLGRELD